MASIILIGFMGSGKTTIGKKLATRLSVPFEDTDDIVTLVEKRTISDIFDVHGETYFRNVETHVLQDALTRSNVLATGGGIITVKDNMVALEKEPYVVYLKGSPITLYKRINKDTLNRRPLAYNKSLKEIESLLEERVLLYESVANFIVDIDSKKDKEAIEAIIRFIEEDKK